MANITSELETIRTAIYGRDMREALADSIEAINDDANALADLGDEVEEAKTIAVAAQTAAEEAAAQAMAGTPDGYANLVSTVATNTDSIESMSSDISSIQTILDSIFLSIYPVGAIYMSLNSTDPSELFGGTWEQLTDRFLLAAGNTYTAGATGGEATHTLTVSEMPAHTHTASQNLAINFDTSDWYGNSGASSAKWVATRLGGGLGITKSPVNNTGGGAAHNNMPPYLSVYMWKRIA